MCQRALPRAVTLSSGGAQLVRLRARRARRQNKQKAGQKK